jgi:hypothetical protein
VHREGRAGVGLLLGRHRGGELETFAGAGTDGIRMPFDPAAVGVPRLGRLRHPEGLEHRCRIPQRDLLDLKPTKGGRERRTHGRVGQRHEAGVDDEAGGVDGHRAENDFDDTTERGRVAGQPPDGVE